MTPQALLLRANGPQLGFEPGDVGFTLRKLGLDPSADQATRRAHVIGRVSLYIESVKKAEDAGPLQKEVERLSKTVESLEEALAAARALTSTSGQRTEPEPEKTFADMIELDGRRARTVHLVACGEFR